MMRRVAKRAADRPEAEPEASPDDRARKEASAAGDDLLPFETSVGYQIRQTNRLLSRYLQQKIGPFGLTLGMWYFLRALWHQDGLTQSELSLIVGTMEPTTLTAVKAMERKGFVRRERNAADRRKLNVYLTERGRALKVHLLPLAKEVVDASVDGFSDRERSAFLEHLNVIQKNLRARIESSGSSGSE